MCLTAVLLIKQVNASTVLLSPISSLAHAIFVHMYVNFLSLSLCSVSVGVKRLY